MRVKVRGVVRGVNNESHWFTPLIRGVNNESHW